MRRVVRTTGTVVLVITALVLVALRISPKGRFDETGLDSERIAKHIEVLSSEAYDGRIAGAPGNERTLAYVEEVFAEAGLMPAGEQGGWYQNFSVMVPQFDEQPRFIQYAEDGSILKEFIMYEDYNLIASIQGGSVDFEGELIIAGASLFNLDPAMIRDRIVVMEAFGTEAETMSYVMKHGGKGVLVSTDSRYFGRADLNEAEKRLSTSGKTGEAIAVGFISRTAYRYLFRQLDDRYKPIYGERVGTIGPVRLKADITFPIVETRSILGKIEGRGKGDRVLLLSADIDGAGAGTDGRYFPGAVSSASGIALLLELVRVIAGQEDLPYRDILFAGWNAGFQDHAGVLHYLGAPILPLERTSVMHFDALGEKTLEGTKISSDSIHSRILKDKILQYSRDAGLSLRPSRPVAGAAALFADRRVPAVLISDLPGKPNTYADTFDRIDLTVLENSARVPLAYIKRDIFRDTRFDYLNRGARIVIVLLAAGLLFSLGMGAWYRRNPELRVGRRTLEELYFLAPVVMVRRVFFLLVRAGAGLAVLVFLANLDPGMVIVRSAGGIESNGSGYLILKRSLLFFIRLFSADGAGADGGAWGVTGFPGTGTGLSLIAAAGGRSLKLLLCALLLAAAVGIAGGLIEGYRTGRRSLRSIGTLVVFSVPDVLVVLISLLFYVFIARNLPGIDKLLQPQKFLLPLLALTILPAIYISRITFVTTQEELKKDYVRNATAKGMSRKRIFFNEMVPAVLFRTVDSLPALMTLLLSNLIIVEYLFNYLGLVYYLLYFHGMRNTGMFIVLAVTLGMFYAVFARGIQLAAQLIDPLKRGAVQ